MKNILTNEDNHIYIKGKIEDSFKLLQGLKEYDLIKIHIDELHNNINEFIITVDHSLSLLKKRGLIIIPIESVDCEVVREILELTWANEIKTVYIETHNEKKLVLTNASNEDDIESLLEPALFEEAILNSKSILEICDKELSSLVDVTFLLELIQPGMRSVTVICDDANTMNRSISKYKNMSFIEIR